MPRDVDNFDLMPLMLPLPPETRPEGVRPVKCDVDFGSETQVSDRPDLSKPSFKGLQWLLLHPEEWRRTHRWNFTHYLLTPYTESGGDAKVRLGDCKTAGCAMGIAHLYWGVEAFTGWRRQLQRMSHRVCGPERWHAIFGEGADTSDACRITPAVVAGRIEDHLAGRPIRYLKAGDQG